MCLGGIADMCLGVIADMCLGGIADMCLGGIADIPEPPVKALHVAEDTLPVRPVVPDHVLHL